MLEVSLWPREILSRMQLSQIPHFQSWILFSNLVTESYANPHTPWKPINTIRHQNSSNSLPESPDAFSLVNTDFIEDKLERIHTKFLPSDSPDPFLFPSAPPPKLINFIFQPLSLKFTNSLLLLKVNNIPLIPSQLCFWNSVLMKLVQSSQTLSISLFMEDFSIVIQTSSCPASSKTIYIRLSTDPSLSTDDLSNFRPISNLNFISKMLEKVDASHIRSPLSS